MANLELTHVSSKYEQLRYLALNGIPCPRVYGVVKIGEMLKGEMHSRLLLRSNHRLEIDGFEGVFDSLDMGFNTQTLREYCAFKRLNPEEVLAGLELVVQENVPYPAIGSIYVHPHDPKRFFIDCKFKPFEDAEVYTSEIDAEVVEKDNLDGNNNHSFEILHFDRHKKGIYGWSEDAQKRCDAIQKRLIDIVLFYKKVSSLPEFDKGWSMEMEFGLGLGMVEDTDIHALQLRDFKLKEKASFTLNPANFDMSRCMATDLVYGITEGTIVNFLHAHRGNCGNKYTQILEETEGTDLMIEEPPLTKTFIPYKALSRLKILLIETFGVFHRHTDFRNAKEVPFLYFAGKPTPYNFFEKERALPIGTLTPFRLYSDGKTGIVERIV